MAFLLHQRSRYDALTLEEVLSALLLHNELKQNHFSACYHLVAWLKAQKGKQILGLSC